MPRIAIIVIAILVATGAGPEPVAARSLESKLGTASELVGISSGSAFDALAESIADTAARSLPVISSSAGFTYRYNTDTELFERTSETLGPLFLERPDTLGKGKFNVGVSFQYVEFNAFDGQDLTDLHNDNPIVVQAFDAAGNPAGLRANRLRYSLGLQNYVTAISLTYGILDNLDVNLLVPIIVTNLRIGVHSQEVATGVPGGPFSPSAGPRSSDAPTAARPGSATCCSGPSTSSPGATACGRPSGSRCGSRRAARPISRAPATSSSLPSSTSPPCCGDASSRTRTSAST